VQLPLRQAVNAIRVPRRSRGLAAAVRQVIKAHRAAATQVARPVAAAVLLTVVWQVAARLVVQQARRLVALPARRLAAQDRPAVARQVVWVPRVRQAEQARQIHLAAHQAAIPAAIAAPSNNSNR
jgi:hypothetical protein